jgi:hypothetical protein
MGWAARRTTTLNEDKVYCLLGIFGVFLSLIYRVGEAYITLQLKEETQKRQEGCGTGSLRNLSDMPSPSKVARFCASCTHLTVTSTLVATFPPKRTVVGRTDELRYLKQYFLVPNTHWRRTIYGLGGCGKSALAIEFAYRALATRARLVF